MPNRVSCNGSNEITLTEIVTAINLIDYERGGIAWKTALPYQPGDLVSMDLAGPGMYELYRCMTPHTSVDITVPAEFNNWELVTTAEIGGVHYKGASEYSVGDIVTADVDNGVDPITTSVYRCTATYTSGAGTPVSFNAEIANWTELEGGTERGGIAWNVSTNYEKGDVVVDLTDFSTYKCTFTGTTNQPAAQVGGWDPVVDPEIGGVAWSDTHLYDIGDTITYNGIIYISLTDTGNLGVLPNTAPLKWKALEGVDERGGIAWEVTTNYAKGDIVVNLSDFSTYKCTINDNLGNVPSSTLSGWIKLVDPELGGLVYDATLNYATGTVITENDIAYIAIVDTALNQPPSTHPGKYVEIGGSEKGGVAWDTDNSYDLGDTVSFGQQLYIANKAIPELATDPTIDTTSWDLVEAELERGGISWQVAIDYLVGDIIMSDHTGPGMWKQYYCNTSHTSVDAATDAANWTCIETEQGGIAYNTTTTYNSGDIVTDTNVTPRKTYISLVDTNTNNALVNTAFWQELDSIFYNAPTGGDANGDGTYVILDDGSIDGGTQHCPWDSASGDTIEVPVTPNTLGEYPETNGVTSGTPEIIGAIWYVSGLGTKTDGSPITYTMTTGNLTGIVVVDGDKFTWVSGLTNQIPREEVWLWTPRPRISGERGGILYKSGESYLIGDLATFNGITYIALTDNIALQPDISPTDWKVVGERGGVAWDVSTAYEKGDIVVDLSDFSTYKCTFTGTTNQPSLQVGGWDPVVDPEIGGVAWSDTHLYDIGDVITYNGIIYISLTNTGNLGVIPETAPLKWQPIEAAVERGGIAWNATTNYSKGDMVVNLSDFATYKCNMNNNLGNVPSSNLSGWDRAIPDERGGLIWQPLLQYYKGDIVTDDLTMRQYYAIKDNMGMQPSIDLPDANWSPVSEIGGRAYRLVAYYDIGDIVTNPVDGLVYVSLTDDNQSNEPELNPTDWEQLVEAEPERGGVSWRAAQDYLVGDIVMSDHSGPGMWKQYYCNTSHLSVDAATDAANWSILDSTEVGGIAWTTLTEYSQGDIVYDIIDDTPYVALVSPVTDLVSIPSTNLVEWKAITGTAGSLLNVDYRFSTTTTGDPGTGKASGDHSDNTLVTNLMISYIDEDGGDREYGLELLEIGDLVSYREHGNNPHTYTYVINADTIDQGTYIEIPVTFHKGSASGELSDNERISVEVLFLRKPQTPERGGIAWNVSTNYEKGDVVVDLTDFSTYKCTFTGTTNQPSLQVGGWDPVVDPEIGGVAWVNDYLYDIGDTITYNGILYISLTDTGNLGVLPDTAPLKWQAFEGSEQGGVFYKSTTTYEVGDIITADDGTSTSVYRCITGYTSAATGLPADFLAELINWTRLESTVATMLQATYTFGTAVGGNPPVGYAQINNVDPALANEVHINETDNHGVDKSYGLQALRIGDWVSIIDTNSNKSYSYHITADPIDMGGWYKMQGAYHRSTGTFNDNEDVFIEVLFVHKNQEQGGVFYQGTTVYNVGDIITADDGTDTGIYRCLVGYTSASNGLPGDFVLEMGNWLKLDTPHGYVSEVNQATFIPAEGSNDFFDYGFTQDALIDTMTGLNAGDTGTIVIRQDTVGGWLATWAAEYLFPSGTPVLGVNPFDVDLFNYYVLSPIHVVVEFVSSMNIPITAPIAITDFAATDAETNKIIFTFTETPGEIYDLYDSVGLVQAGISSGDDLPITGTENYFVKSINLAGIVDSNIDSGTGILVTIVVITDFNASDNQYNQVTMTWTETVGETYDLYNTAGLIQVGVSTGYVFTVDGMDDYYVKAIVGGGSEDSNTESGEGLVTLVAITDFAATDGDTTFVTVTFTPQP